MIVVDKSPPRSTMIHHSQSDRGGLRLQDNRQAGESIHLNWLIGVGIEVVDWGVLTHQPADCPEAEARHGQTGSS
jgi:hypothetical protein